MLVTSIFSFTHIVFKRLLSLGVVKSRDCVVKGKYLPKMFDIKLHDTTFKPFAVLNEKLHCKLLTFFKEVPFGIGMKQSKHL